MASVLKVNGKWRAQVRRKGIKTQTQTFSTKKRAELWAAKVETDLEARRAGIGVAKGKTGFSMSDIFLRALQEPGIGRTKLNVLQHLKEGFGHINNEDLSSQHIVSYVLTREYSPSTAQQEVSILGTALQIAEHAWGYYIPPVIKEARTALKLMGKIGKSRERSRRPTEDEIERLCKWFDEHSALPIRDLIWFAIHTTMRASEITNLLWDDYNQLHKTIIVRDRKDPKYKEGNDHEVPLLDAAVEIIERQPRTCEYIFPYNHKTFSSVFPRACQLMENRIKDLRWHDLRHEGTSRLFEMGYQIHEVAMFTGHKDWKQLKRYTQLRAKDLRRLGGVISSGKQTTLDALLPVNAIPECVDMASAEISQELIDLELREQKLTEIEKYIQDRRQSNEQRKAELEDEIARRRFMRARIG